MPLTGCLQPGCPELVEIGSCWCWEHLHHCDDPACPHGAHHCEGALHFCGWHGGMTAEERDGELVQARRRRRRLDAEIAKLRAERQRLAEAGELSEAHAELIDAEIESLRLRRYDPGDEAEA